MSQIQRIRFVRQLVGPRLNWRVGDKAWVGDGPGMVSVADARRLVDAGIVEVLRRGVVEPVAEPEPEPKPESELPPVEEPEVETEPVIETATQEPPENAATLTGRRRGRPRKKG